MTGNLQRRLVWSETEYHKEIDISSDLNHEAELERVLPPPNYGRPLSKNVAPNNSQGYLARPNLISSEEWLRIHGLKTKKLTLSQILSQIGFPHQEDYVSSIGKTVASRYANGLFRRFCKAEDGTVYRLIAKTEFICPFMKHLNDAAECLQKRMNWLTSGSRQIFGVILDKCITIVLDFGSLDEEKFSLCQDALVMVIEEQVAHLTRFNLIRAAQIMTKWQCESVFAGEEFINSAIRWIKELVCKSPVAHNSAINALHEAQRDNSVSVYAWLALKQIMKQIAAIYYFVVGDVLEESKQLLLHSVTESSRPIHTVSFNARGEDTINFLKELSTSTRGRFHAFAARVEPMGIHESPSGDGNISFSSNLRKLKERVPPGSGVREDVYLIWRELEETRNTLAQIQKIVDDSMKPEGSEASRDSSSAKGSTSAESLRTSIHRVNQKLVERTKRPELSPKPSLEDRLDSKKWLQKFGLKAQKLTAFDILAECSFRHIDGIVDVKGRPDNMYLQTCAGTNKKNVHAKYCNKFVHTPWKDGTMVHVYVTADKCKAYEEKMSNALELIEKRIEWLQNGSQGLFGLVLEDYIYILIDTSHSMKGKLPLVKEKIFQLLTEQLVFKKKFNFVKFDGKAVAWQGKLAEVNEDNLKMAKEWVKNLQVGSSTNTMDALKTAFADKETKVIYILTDGRPDQPVETIFCQIQHQKKIPIHTVSFNYHDEDANEFLKELSLRTGGEFHYFHFGSPDPLEPGVYVNKQLNLLLREIEMGQNDLERVQNLYTESMLLDWWHNTEKDEETEYKKPTYAVVSTTESTTDIPLQKPTLRTVSPAETGFFSPCGSPPQTRLKKKAPFAEPTKTSLLRNSFIEKKLSEESSIAKKHLPPEQKRSSRKQSCSLNCKEMNSIGEKLSEMRSRETSQDSLDMSSETWLKVHGLVAKRLTIMNALSATTIPHSSKYVPILGKHVVSKVYDSIFTLKQVGSNTEQMILINPHALNLKTYRHKVEQAVKSYERRLNLLIWKAFSPEEREKFKIQEPVQYLENKEAIQEALQEVNWPISLEDVLLLENEIQAGNTYIQQTKEIQEATKKENCQGDQSSEIPQLTYKATPSVEKGPIVHDKISTSSIDYLLASMEGQVKPRVLETVDHASPPALVPSQTPRPPSRETPSEEMEPATNANRQLTAMQGQEPQRREEPLKLLSHLPAQDTQLSSREAFPMEMSLDIHVNCQPASLNKKKSPRAPETAAPLKPLPSAQTSSSSRVSSAMEKKSTIPPTPTINCRPTAKDGKKRPKSSQLVSASKPLYRPSHPQRSLSEGTHHLEKRPSVPITNYTNSPSRRRKSQQNQEKKFKSKRVDPLKGQKVIARSEENGFYFPGTVIKCVGPTHALVQFKHGEARVVPIIFITPVGGAMPCPVLQVGDYVFAKIVIQKGYDFYVPAIITATPSEDEPYDRFYTVLKCNNRRDFCLRSGLIKISQNKYALSCSFISSTLMKEPPKQEEEMNSDFMLFPFEEVETGPLRDLTDENSKRNKNKKKFDIKKQSQDVLSSDSGDSPYEAETHKSCSKARDGSRGGGFPDSVSKENSNKYTKSYAHQIKTFPKCQRQSKTLNSKKSV